MSLDLEYRSIKYIRWTNYLFYLGVRMKWNASLTDECHSSYSLLVTIGLKVLILGTVDLQIMLSKPLRKIAIWQLMFPALWLHNGFNICYSWSTINYFVYIKLQKVRIWKQEHSEQKMFYRHILQHTVILVNCMSQLWWLDLSRHMLWSGLIQC